MSLMRTIIKISAAVGVLALAGCTSTGTPNDAGSTTASSQVALGEGVTDYPLTMENCGTTVTVESTPERAVTLNQAAAEILIHLGVSERIVGTGYEIDQVPDDIAAEYDAIPLLGVDGATIAHETLLSAQPDFVYSQFASFLTADQSGEREELHQLGVPTYLTEFDCVMHGSVDNASFELMYQEYEDLAAIFDVPGAGEELIAEQKAVVDDGLATAEGIEGTPTLMWFYSTYGGTPYMAGPGGLPQHVTELVGAANVFDDASTKWPETSWDEVAARNPDVIILADLTRGEPGDTAQEKIEILKGDPLTSQLDAVKNDRFIIVPGRYMDPSYGSVYSVPAVAEGLVELQQQP
ncbi:MAG: ABC transporter substrate-binding protein [Arachnia sp.]